jgi:hypothetical protein
MKHIEIRKKHMHLYLKKKKKKLKKAKMKENNLKSRTEAAVARVYQILKLIERCFFPEVVWQLIPSF